MILSLSYDLSTILTMNKGKIIKYNREGAWHGGGGGTEINNAFF
jgi:hypothetical protein